MTRVVNFDARAHRAHRNPANVTAMAVRERLAYANRPWWRKVLDWIEEVH